MNDMAAAPSTDPSAWDLLVQRAKDDGSLSVTTAEVFEVEEVDPERFAQDLESIRKRLGEQGITLDEGPDADEIPSDAGNKLIK